MVSGRGVRNVIKYGPIIAEVARRHGPQIADQVRRHGPQVVNQARSRFTSSQDGRSTGSRGTSFADATPRREGSVLDATPLGHAAAKRRALNHARSVVDGSALRVFHHARPIWVVFSGSTPVGTHPDSTVSFGELLRHADLSQAMRPRKADVPAGSGPTRDPGPDPEAGPPAP